MPYEVEKDSSGPPDFAEVELSDVIDVPALQEMMDDYYALTGIGVGIVDLKGTVLVGTGWQDICVMFHRVVPESCAYCHQSDISLSSDVPPGTFREYRCKNNMWDIATPIMLGERHIGNIFLGQFLYDDEEPDYELFRTQARRFGYDEEEYLAALDRVPRFSRKTVHAAMGFYSKMAQMISKANYNNVILADTLARRERAEKALRMTRISVEAASDALIWVDADTRIVDVNEAACRSLGYSREELLRLSVPDINIRFTAEKWRQHFDLLRQKGTLTFENQLITKDGRMVPVEIAANYVKLDDTELNCSFVRDISDRKQAEEKLRASEEALRVIFNNAHDAIFIHEISGDILDVNDKMLEMYGVDRSTAKTLSIIGHYSGPANPFHNVPSVWNKVVAGENQLFEWQSRRIDDGSLFDVEVSLHRITLNQRHVILATVRDITARKQAEQAIDHLNKKLAARAAELEAVNRDLEAFNYTVSHDLRTPITAISTCNQIIQARCGDHLDEEIHKVFSILDSQIVRMDQIITTLLDFSRLASCPVGRETVDLSSLAEIVVSQQQMSDPQRCVSFAIAEGVEAPGDAQLLTTVLENLIGNAWKYTVDKDLALIEFGVAEMDGIKTYFVKDNGAGFDMEYANKLLLPFQRLPGAEKCQGYGIGLATVERIISRHGGRVWAEGEPGKGATFYFTLSGD